ncbi:hypothetical protein DPMN_017952 [Dreissena polymorpha]|uniref:Uncharacterized protein n=1 Tax=Dreissena polymorpha TaxID=45954 RepID=A0A9D4NG93_DREPO|nr:hypothetical protein DPMN_017952 [Dreissena polymorpha]
MCSRTNSIPRTDNKTKQSERGIRRTNEDYGRKCVNPSPQTFDQVAALRASPKTPPIILGSTVRLIII